MTWLRVLALATVALLGVTACAKRMQRTMAVPADVETLDRKAPYLKAHTRQGTVYVLAPWLHDVGAGAIRGTGTLLDVNRAVIDSGDFAIPLDSAVLFETNVVRTSGSVAALGVLTGASLGLTAYCLSNTKACFGSCPTFYADTDDGTLLVAEGFSASIAPSLEARDIDALRRAPPTGPWYELRLTNEALETHVIRYADLLAVNRLGAAAVFADAANGFWRASAVLEPTSCEAPEGNCRASVRAFDGEERRSFADSADLAAREIVDLTFPFPGHGSLGVVIASRQTLLPTFLLYQTFAWLGSSAGTWLAALERADESTRGRLDGIARAFGGVEVLVQEDGGRWVWAGTVSETGPLGSDLRVLPLPEHVNGHRVRLRMAKGAWRIDYVALASLRERAAPVRIPPSEVRHRGGRAPAVLETLLDSTAFLVTLPGDEYVLRYRLPDDFDDQELFLDSRGYYLEWMREEWMADENPARATKMFLDPAGTLRDLAPAFKQVEPDMEDVFWRSRYVRP